MLIIMNLSGTLQKIEAPGDIREYKPVVSTHEVFKQGGNVIYLQPYSAFVLSIQ